MVSVEIVELQMCEYEVNLTKMQSTKARVSQGSTSSLALEEIQKGRESSNFGQNAGLKQIWFSEQRNCLLLFVPTVFKETEFCVLYL